MQSLTLCYQHDYGIMLGKKRTKQQWWESTQNGKVHKTANHGSGGKAHKTASHGSGGKAHKVGKRTKQQTVAVVGKRTKWKNAILSHLHQFYHQ